MMENNDVILGKYQHFRNQKLYEIIGLARHSETLEEMVVYRALYHSEQFGENQVWVRPKEMFFELVDHDGQRVPRFKLIEG